MLRKLLFAGGLVLLHFSSSYSQTLGNIDYRMPGAPLPPMRVVTEDGKVYTEKDAETGENFFVMMFSPTCDHCHEVTHTLINNEKLFKDRQLLLVAAPNMIPHLDYFNNTTRYKKYPVIRVGVDSAQFIEKTFGYNTLPQINIYDRSRKLVRVFTGTTPIDSLKPYLGPNARQYVSSPVAPPKMKTTKRKRGR